MNGKRRKNGKLPPWRYSLPPVPVREPCPLVPRPAVLPWPAEIPRPTRFRFFLYPIFGTRSCSFIFLAATSSFLLRGLQIVQRIKGGHDHIQHIGATHRLCEDVTNPSHFQNSAYTASSDNPGPGGSRFEQNTPTSHFAQDLMRDGCPSQVDSPQILPS